MDILTEKRIIKIMDVQGDIRKDELLKMARPYTESEIDLLIEQQVDEDGARNCFICEKDGMPYYVNIETTQSMELLNTIIRQLDSELVDISTAIQKVRQMKLDLSAISNDQN